MKKFFALVCVVMVAFPMWAGAPHVTLEQLNNGGWERYRGQAVCITTPLIVCGTLYDSLILSDERLFVPDEHAYGLADGDSTEYKRLAAYNRQHRIRLECRTPFNLNTGARVTNLTARVVGVRRLETGATPHFVNYRPSKRLPQLANADVVICSANIQNYFVHVGGYATKRNTPGQHALQAYKVASALVRFKADLYTLCELEQGDAAPIELAAKMNELCHQDRYAPVIADTCDRDTISVGFIYNKERMRPVGPVRFAYHEEGDPTALQQGNIYAHRFMLQCFEDLATGERFVVSLNHPRSKRGNPEEATAKRMENTKAILAAIEEYKHNPVATREGSEEPEMDFLLLGDYNAYAQEKPLQAIVRAGFQDMNMTLDSTGYSYSFNAECGYLDRCYASPSMAAQMVALHPVHWNTDFYRSAAYYAKYNYKKRSIPKEVPANIRRVMAPVAKKNLLFRYADHDPLLIGLKLGK